MILKIHLRFVFFLRLATHTLKFCFMCVCVRERERVSEREGKIERNPVKWMAKHLNNEPYLHFKAYSNKDNNGLGSTWKERKSWELYARERATGCECERDGRGTIACNLFYGTGACTLNAHLITRTRRGCCCRLPCPLSRRQIKLISTFCVVSGL